MSRTLLEAARTAVRRTTDAFDGEITDLIKAALADMRRQGIVIAETVNKDVDVETIQPLTLRGAMLYVQANFGMDGDVEKKQRLERIYNELCRAMALTAEYNGGQADG